MNNPKPEYLVCQKCNNRLKEGYEYFYLLWAENEGEVVGKCSKCKLLFNRELKKERK